MPRNQDRDASATRIAVTLGALVAVVMLGIWGATALAGSATRGLTPAKTRVAAKPATATAAPATATAAATEAAKAAAADRTQPAVAPPRPAPKPAAPKPAAPKPAVKYVVVIDPGHGGELSGTEAMGPWNGAPQKPKTNYGAEGEAAVALKVSLKLRPLLEARGVKVIMTRTGPKALSNKSRAMIANDAKADLFLRLHCDGADGSSARGISMQVPGDSRGWAPIAQSRRAGETILAALIRGTGASNRGIASRSGNANGLVGFNWSKVPTVVPEMGFLSNPSEAAKLKSDAYQQKLAQAIADGTMKYLQTVR